MFICKRCHTISRTNPRGLCSTCADYIDMDIKQSSRKIKEIRADIDRTIGYSMEGKKDAYLPEVSRIVVSFQKYYHWGYWVLPDLERARGLLISLDICNPLLKKPIWK